MSLASPSARPRFAAVSLLALAGSLRAERSTEVLPCRPTFADGPISQRFQDDLTLGAKLRLLRTDETAFSISATASLPTPGRQTGYLKTYHILLTALVSRELPPGATADLNLGLESSP